MHIFYTVYFIEAYSPGAMFVGGVFSDFVQPAQYLQFELYSFSLCSSTGRSSSKNTLTLQ